MVTKHNAILDLSLFIYYHLQRLVFFRKVLYFCFVGVKYGVEVESGMDENKGLEILALYTNNKPQGLPEEARSIVRECKGV